MQKKSFMNFGIFKVLKICIDILVHKKTNKEYLILIHLKTPLIPPPITVKIAAFELHPPNK